MEFTLSKSKAVVAAVCACALVACIGVSSVALADDSAQSASDSATAATTTGDFIKGAATRAAGPALEILGLASVEESGQFVDTSSWYSWSYPKYYLCASDYNEELSPFLYNLANSTGSDTYPAAVLNTSRSGGGNGPNASLSVDGTDDTDMAVWALEPDVVLGTGGGVDYSDYGATGVAYSFSSYESLIETMDAIAEAADKADSSDSSRTLRFGSASDIAQDYEEYILGTMGLVQKAIDDGAEKKTVVLVEGVSGNSNSGYEFDLMTTDEAGGDGTAATNRYLETTSNTGISVFSYADNYADTQATVTLEELESDDIDLILVGGQSSSGNYSTIEAVLENEGLLYKTYLVDSSSRAGAMYGVVMNSVENAQNIGRILGCLYPDIVSQQDWLAYYYETFYHIDSSSLVTVMDSALDGVRCWGNGTTTAGAYTYTQVTAWDAEDCGYTNGSDAASVEELIATGYEYYQDALGDAATDGAATNSDLTEASTEDDAVTEETADVAATKTVTTISEAGTLSTASLSTLDDDSTAVWTVEDSSGNKSTSSTFPTKLSSGDVVTLNEDAEEDISIVTYDSGSNTFTDGEDSECTIDLAGHTLTGGITINVSGTINVVSTADSEGTIKNTTSFSNVDGGSFECASGTVNIENICLETCDNASSSSDCCASIYVSSSAATLTLKNVDVLQTPDAIDEDAISFSMGGCALLVSEGTVYMEDSTLTTKAENGGGGSGSPRAIYCKGGTLEAKNCEIAAELGNDAGTTPALYAVQGASSAIVSFEDCEISAKCEGTGSRSAIAYYGAATTASFDSCAVTVYAPNVSTPLSLSCTAKTNVLNLSGEMFMNGKAALGTSNSIRAAVYFYQGLTLSEPLVTSSKYASITFASSQDDEGNSVNWTADEAEAIATMVTYSSGTYCGSITYDTDDETLPATLALASANSTSTNLTCDSSIEVTAEAGVSDDTLSAQVLDASSNTIDGASVTWNYYGDESCTQLLDAVPSAVGTYYCRAIYAGNYSNSYAASISDVVTLTISCEHSYEGVVTDPTCTEGGYTTYTCSKCGDSYVADETEATGHSYGSPVLYEEDGVYIYTYTCIEGDDSYTIDVSAAYAAGYSAGADEAAETVDEDSASYASGYAAGAADAAADAAETVDTDSASYASGYEAGYAAATPASLSGATVAVAKSSCTYTGKAIEPAVTVTLSDGTVLVEGTDYTVVYLNNESVGTATVLVVGAGSYTGAAVGSFAIVQAKQSLKVTKKAKTAKYSKVKKKAVTLKAITKVSGAKGTVSYSLVSAKKGSKSFKAKFKVNAKNGKITVKKGTKKGTYKVKVKVSAAATAGYKAASKTVTVKIKVK